MMDMMISNIRAPRLLFQLFFLFRFSIWTLGFSSFFSELRFWESWACAGRITSFLLFWSWARIRVKHLLFWYPPRRSTTIFILETDWESSWAWLSLRDLFFDGLFWAPSKICLLSETWNADVIHPVYADHFASFAPFVILHIVRICFDTHTHFFSNHRRELYCKYLGHAIQTNTHTSLHGTLLWLSLSLNWPCSPCQHWHIDGTRASWDLLSLASVWTLFLLLSTSSFQHLLLLALLSRPYRRRLTWEGDNEHRWIFILLQQASSSVVVTFPVSGIVEVIYTARHFKTRNFGEIHCDTSERQRKILTLHSHAVLLAMMSNAVTFQKTSYDERLTKSHSVSTAIGKAEQQLASATATSTATALAIIFPLIKHHSITLAFAFLLAIVPLPI